MSTIIERHGYRVEIVSPKLAIVSGGILTKPIRVTRLLGKGDSNPKTAKNKILTFGLSLFPWKGIGFGNVCPHAKTCVASCLAHQGQGPMPSVFMPRIAKTVLYNLARDWFMAMLTREITAKERNNPRVKIAIRLNMLSDVPWEHLGIIDAFPRIQFYDYTKNPRRWGQVRPNYWVTFSYDGTNGEHAKRVLQRGGNVAIVFYDTDGKCGKAAHRQTLPDFVRFGWHRASVIDGGVTDYRPEDPKGVIVGLRLLARTYASRNQGIDDGFAVKCDGATTVRLSA